MGSLKLSNKEVEDLWKEFADLALIAGANGEPVLGTNWFIFEPGTRGLEILDWFDRNHSCGVGWLMDQLN